MKRGGWGGMEEEMIVRLGVGKILLIYADCDGIYC